MNSFYVSVFPGLTPLVAEGLVRSGIKTGDIKRMRNAELVMVQAARPEPLMELRMFEDIFALLGSLKLTGSVQDLKTIGRLPAFGGPVTRALNFKTPRGYLNRVSFRVVVQADDAVWRQYRRVDMQRAAETALMGSHPGWKLTPESAPVEIWLQQIDKEVIVGLRLTTGLDRQHGGRAVEREAALRPSVAAAMVELTRPEPNDVFMDPMCGSGTILLERAISDRYALLLGGDSDVKAVQATLENFGPRHKPRRIERWDARNLPIEPTSVNKIACNLPWGRKVGEGSDLPELYAKFLTESVRVLTPGGIMVLLTSEWELLKRILRDVPELRLERTIPRVQILGRQADIFVIARP